MAQALPSFVDLLASLDLESDENVEVQHYARYPTSPSFLSSSPSSSLPSSLPSSQTSPMRFLASPGLTSSFTAPSPSIIISHPSPVDDSVNARRRSNSNRYNPYVPPNIFARRRSLPGDLTDHPNNVQKKADPARAYSASPPMRRASLGEPSHEISARLSTSRIAMTKTDQPISSLVRRRHPQNSPPGQSPSLSKTARRPISPSDPLIPVSLPSLPPLPPISAGADSPALAFSDFPHLPPISALDCRLPTPSKPTDRLSRAVARTPQSSPRDTSNVSPHGSRERLSRGRPPYGRPSSS